MSAAGRAADAAAAALDAALRLAAALALSLFVRAALAAWLRDPARVSLLLLLVTESVTVALVLLARPPARRDWRPLSVALALAATFYFLALSLDPGLEILPQWAASLLQCLGLGWQIYAKLSLGRSFGLLPADRGLVTTGAYRWVRHPIYLGYFVAHLGFLLGTFGLRNLVVLTALYLLQGMRLLREERLLRRRDDYRDYCAAVRWRALPRVF